MFVRLRNSRKEIYPGNMCALEYSFGNFIRANPEISNFEVALELEKHIKKIFPFTYITEVIDTNFRLQDEISSQKNHKFDIWSYIVIAHQKPLVMVLGFSSEIDMIMSRLIT